MPCPKRTTDNTKRSIICSQNSPQVLTSSRTNSSVHALPPSPNKAQRRIRVQEPNCEDPYSYVRRYSSVALAIYPSVRTSRIEDFATFKPRQSTQHHDVLYHLKSPFEDWGAQCTHYCTVSTIERAQSPQVERASLLPHEPMPGPFCRERTATRG